MVAATAVTVAAIDDIPASDLQSVLGSIYGKAQYAANGVGEAIYKADQANSRLDTLEGTVQWAADTVGSVQGTAQYAADRAGFLDYHLRQIAGMVGYTVPNE